jgi:hypothetical protein
MLYKVSVHLATRFQKRRFFKNRPIRNKNCLWWPYLLTNRDEMNILYRGPTIDTFYQVSVHLAKWFHKLKNCVNSRPKSVFKDQEAVFPLFMTNMLSFLRTRLPTISCLCVNHITSNA